MPHRLMIFTRYPEAHGVKTRLIPALGAEGAAQLHREMTERTVRTARPLRQLGIEVEVRFTGGDATRMQEAFGQDLRYVDQGEGDLGQRLSAAFEAGPFPAIAIGTDCPDLSTHHLLEAFAALREHDVVLGPANDGGYYLIGLGLSAPSIFEGIAWGSANVCVDTQRRIADQHLSIALLSPLSDVDQPEDLPIWERAKLRDVATFR
jgi:rSAM/selenodomain-associated transferase 1